MYAYGANQAQSGFRFWEDVNSDGLFDLVLRTRDKAKPEVKAAVQRADLFEQAYGLHLSIEVRRKGPPPTGAELAPAGSGAGG